MFQSITQEIKFIFRTLRYKNFRLFFVGQGISLIGTWMQQITISWLVYRLTASAFLLGLVQFAGLLPAFLLAPFAGVFADRWNRHRALIVTQSLSMLQALILASLVLTHRITITQIVILGAFLGFVNAFDMPIRQSFLIEMVENKEDLGNAIALNSSLFNAARLLGPSIAGVLIATLGEGICFLLNGLSYIAVIIALWAMEVTYQKTQKQESHVFEQLKEGFVYSMNFLPIKSIILLLAFVNIVAAVPYQLLMPIFAKDILHGGPHTFGFLTAASGAGALTGALYLASRKNFLGLGRMIPIMTSVFGGSLILFSFSRNSWLSIFLMIVAGFGLITQMASSNTLLQTLVEDSKRGRVMSFYIMAFVGTAPFGSLLAGWTANKISAPNTLILGGISCILGALLFAQKLPLLRETVRPIYQQMDAERNESSASP